MSNTEDHQRRHRKTLTKTEEQRQSINMKGCQKLELQQHNGQCQILTRNSRKHTAAASWFVLHAMASVIE